MRMLTGIIATLALSGCASTGAWRAMNIDGSSEDAFKQSVAAMDAELPSTHRELFAIALVDIAQTGTEASVLEQNEYTLDDFRAELDGLTYAEVVALADESGIPVRDQRYARRGSTRYAPNAGFPNSGEGAPAIGLDGRPIPQPGGPGWPLGADARGRAIY